MLLAATVLTRKSKARRKAGLSATVSARALMSGRPGFSVEDLGPGVFEVGEDRGPGARGRPGLEHLQRRAELVVVQVAEDDRHA